MTTLLPFQPANMTPAQLAAVSFLARWRPGNPADNDATAEWYVTEALKTCVLPPGSTNEGGQA